MKKLTKKIIAREFLFLLSSIILFFLILFLWMYLESRNIKEIRNVENQIQLIKKGFQKNSLNLESIFNEVEQSLGLYNIIKQYGLYTKTYEDFKIQFSSKKKQTKLYDALKEKGLYTETLDTFISKYFSNFNGIDEELKLLLIEAKAKEASTYQLNEIVYLYEAKNNNSYKNNIEKISILNEKLKDKKQSIFYSGINEDNLFGLGLIIISVLFGLRYVLYATLWSIKQLKTSNENI